MKFEETKEETQNGNKKTESSKNREKQRNVFETYILEERNKIYDGRKKLTVLGLEQGER